MARQRIVKPDFYQHVELYRAEKASKLPLRLAFSGLWTQCDRRGLFAWKADSLKLNILPFDDVDFEAVLSALELYGFIRSYVVDGRKFGHCPTLARHQPFHKDEKPNKLIPDPPVPFPHGANPVPPSSPHGGSLPTSASVSASTSASPSTSPSASVEGAAATPDVISAFKRALVMAANTALNERFNGNPPYTLETTHPPTLTLAEALLGAGIGLDVAAPSIARQVQSHHDGRIRSMKYFLDGVLQDAAKQRERDAIAGQTAPKPFDRQSRRGSSGWDNVA